MVKGLFIVESLLMSPVASMSRERSITWLLSKTNDACVNATLEARMKMLIRKGNKPK